MGGGNNLNSQGPSCWRANLTNIGRKCCDLSGDFGILERDVNWDYGEPSQISRPPVEKYMNHFTPSQVQDNGDTVVLPRKNTFTKMKES